LPYTGGIGKKELEMLVTRKINLFAFLFGKQQAENKVRAANSSKAQTHEERNLENLDRSITITKCEDFYKAHSISMTNAFSQLNR